MKQLTCEMCGSTDLIKQDGVFICQNCGCKYSVEDAKKMMIEGTVEVQGTVKVDNSTHIKASLDNARRALEKNDWEEVEKYYNKVEECEPHNIEAVFFSAYGKAMLSLYDTETSKRKQKFEVFINSISIIDDYYQVEKSEELEPIIMNMSKQLEIMLSAEFTYNTFYGPSSKWNDRYVTLDLFKNVICTFVESIENITKKDEKIYLYKILLKYYIWCIKSKRIHNSIKANYKEKLYKIIDKIQKLEPDYVAPDINFEEVPNKITKKEKNNLEENNLYQAIVCLSWIIIIIIFLFKFIKFIFG